MKKIFILGDRETTINYVEAVEGVGAQAVCSSDPADSSCCDALLLTGGADINPKLYGEENTASEGIDDLRDSKEYELIGSFLKSKKPILGICRGHQVLAAYFGGTLIQDVPDTEKHSRAGKPYDKVHTITATRDSWLHELYGDNFSVNSAHHQAVKTTDLSIDALSDDGLIEAISDENRKIYGIQFHPERMSFRNRRDDTVDGKSVFQFFVSIL